MILFSGIFMGNIHYFENYIDFSANSNSNNYITYNLFIVLNLSNFLFLNFDLPVLSFEQLLF